MLPPRPQHPHGNFASPLRIRREKPLSCPVAAERGGPGDAAAVQLLVIFMGHK